MRRKSVAATMLAALTLFTAACGSSASKSASTTVASATTGGSSAATTRVSTSGGPTTVATGGACKQPAGPEVKVMAIIDESTAANVLLPDLRAGIQVAVDRVNCDGGLGAVGSKLTADFCIGNYDPNLVQACADKAINDPSYIASVGTDVGEGDTPTAFEKAGMPNIPSVPLELTNFTAKTTFNVNSGSAITAGVATLACKAGLKKVKEIRLAVPATQQTTVLTNASLKAAGCAQLAQSVDMPIGAADVSAQVTAAADGADAVFLVMGPQNAAQVFKTKQQLGVKTPFYVAGVEMTAQTLAAVGDAADGSSVALWHPAADSTSTGEKAFVAAMAAAGKTNLIDDSALAGWVSVDLLQTAAKDLPKLDRPSLLGALNATTAYDADGLMPKVDFSKDGPNATFPRAVNFTISAGIIKNGKIVSDPKLPGFLPCIQS